MATDRVGIEIDLMGYDEAMSQMQNLERSMKGLNGHRNRLKIQAEVEKLKLNRNALKAQKVRIEADTKNVDREIIRTTNKLKKMRNLLKNLKGENPLFGGSANTKAITATEKEIERLIAKVRELNTLKSDMNWRMGNIQSEINQTTSAIQRMEAALRRVKTLSPSQIFSKISSSVGHMGAAMQSAGNALNRLTAPMRMLGSGMLLGAGFGAINKVEEGLASGFSRYDTMTKYNRMMKSFEKGNYTAQKSIDALDKSVQGLPTSLDEMVNLAQRFTMTTGDMQRGTQLAIATNNAFMASMSTDTQRYQGMMQLQDVIGGKKMNAKEWQSLANSMLPAIRMMGEDLGKSGKELDEWVAAVQQGKISNEEFLKALEKTGTGAGKAAKMAEEAKNTWEAFSARIGTAFSRMMYGALQSFDKIVESLGLVDKDGKAIKTLNQLLDDKVINGINNLAKASQNFIDSHANEIKEFFTDLAGIDWKGLGTGFLDGFKTLASMIQTVAKELKGKDLKNVGKAIFWMQALASSLTIGGGLFKGARHIIGGIGTGLVMFARGIGALGTVLGGTAVIKGLKNIKAIKNLKWVAWFMKTFKGVGKVAGAGASAGGAAAGGAILKGFLPAIEIVAGIGAVATEILGIAWIDTKILKENIDNIIAITDGMKTVFNNVKGLKSGGVDMGAARSAVSDMFQLYSIISGTEDTGTRANRGARGLTKGAGGGVTANGLGDMNPFKLNMFAKSMEYMKKAFGSIKGVVTTLVGMQESMSQLSTMSGSPGSGQTAFDNIAFQIRNLMNGLSGIMTSVDGIGDVSGIEAKTTSLVTAVQNIKNIVTKLNALGEGGLSGGGTSPAFGAIQQIKTMVSQLGQALNTETIGALQMQVSQFKSAVDQIFETLNGDLDGVEVTVKIKGKVTGQDKLISDINKAKNDIMSAVRRIPNSITRHVYIHVNPHVNVGNFHVPTASELGGGQYRGGLITGKNGRALYRAKGGSIFGNIFKPKGTDTVPAMLTPGEYVHRREAVDTFGVRFMQAVNRLDVAGAFRELSARMGSSVMSRRGTTIYNNITNNSSPTINQTVNTQNPNFVFKRPSRYITAL